MRRLTRRRLLALGGTGLAGTLGGCSGGPNSNTPVPADDDDEEATARPTETTATTTSGPELRHPDFAAVTGRIADGIAWHATRWEDVMAGVRTRAHRVTGKVDGMLSADAITEHDIEELQRRTTVVADYLREHVVPHYGIEGPVLNGNNVYVQQVKIASQRGDADRRRQYLTRLASLYGNYTRSAFLESTFQNGPIHAKLYDDLVADGSDAVFGVFHPPSGFVEVATPDRKPKDSTTDGVSQHVHEFPSGHVVVAHVHDHASTHDLGGHDNEPPSRRLYAYRNGQFDILRDANLDRRRFSDFEPELADIFDSVSVPDRREDVVYATVTGMTGDFADLPLQIQRFDSAATAAEAVDFLLSADVFHEGTRDVAGRAWRRVYYTQQGTNLYAFLLRTGKYVTTLFPEPVAWDQRVDWPGPFERTWITA